MSLDIKQIGKKQLHFCLPCPTTIWFYAVRCQFPFTWAGSEYRGCTFSATPSSEDSACSMLRRQAKEADLTKAPVKIVDGHGKTLNTCFDTSPRDYGW